MLSEHFASSKIFNNIFDTAREVLGVDFKKLIFEGTSDDLSATEVTQPLLLTANQAIWKTTNLSLSKVELMAGHSLGEYSAYVAAESLGFEEALTLVSLRAKFMQEAVKEGEGRAEEKGDGAARRHDCGNGEAGSEEVTVAVTIAVATISYELSTPRDKSP